MPLPGVCSFVLSKEEPELREVRNFWNTGYAGFVRINRDMLPLSDKSFQMMEIPESFVH